MVASALPAEAAGADGLPGAVGAFGVTALEGAEADEVPMALVATTVNVYAVSLVNPATVQVNAVAGVGVQVLVASSTALTL
jgi:hypothetical protein